MLTAKLLSVVIALQLQAHIESNVIVPSADSFEMMINQLNDCELDNYMWRLYPHMSSPGMRKLVWKRMKYHQLIWVSAGKIKQIERIAEAVGEPLK